MISLVSCQEDVATPHPQAPAQTAWYLLQCKPRQNFRAEKHLLNQGFTCYQPVVQTERIQQGKRRDVSEPLFPGYLFIRLCSVNDNWGPIRSTRGVTRMVGFNGHPYPVPDTVIDALRQRIAHQPRIVALQPSDRVTITHGAFANVEAIFKTYDGDERVVILLNLMHREQPLVLPVSSIEKREGACA
jgi:transcriptional antiterminator RfaH